MTAYKGKTAIFVVGEADSGKSSIIRALTGSAGRRNPWRVRTLGGRAINALVVISALQESDETKKVNPRGFPETLERLENVDRKDYELLICPLELSSRLRPEDYLRVFLSKGFEVRVATIERDHNDAEADATNLARLWTFITANGLRTVGLDVFNSDHHMQARKVRDNLFPS